MQYLSAAVLCLLFCAAYGQGKCNVGCTVDADCEGDANCNLCMDGKCHAGCGGTCVGDKDCGDANCGFCQAGSCQNSPAHVCGQSCSVNTDCSGDSNCQLCVGGLCSAGCGNQCAHTTECIGECAHCILGICSADNVTCNGNCKTSLDCIQTSECNTCILGQCGAACQQPCVSDTQCITSGCKHCNVKPGMKIGQCQQFPGYRTCGQTCQVNDQCTGSPGTCQSCIRGHCGSGCSQPCVHSTDCAVFHCKTCAAGKCTSP